MIIKIENSGNKTRFKFAEIDLSKCILGLNLEQMEDVLTPTITLQIDIMRLMEILAKCSDEELHNAGEKILAQVEYYREYFRAKENCRPE